MKLWNVYLVRGLILCFAAMARASPGPGPGPPWTGKASPFDISNRTRACFRPFELLTEGIISDPVGNVHLGLRPDEDHLYRLPAPFKLTRLVWSVQPNPNSTDPNTYVFSYPPDFIFATFNDSSLTFQPTRKHIDYTGEAGVLVWLPQNENLKSLTYLSAFTPGSDRIQVLDARGFPSLSRIELNTSDQYTDISPGQGVCLKVMADSGPSRILSSPPPVAVLRESNSLTASTTAGSPSSLVLTATGSGILVQADVDRIESVHFENAVKSRLELRFQQVERGFEFVNSNDTQVFLEGPVSMASQPIQATSDVELQVFDPTGGFQCAGNDFACFVLENATLQVEPSLCITLPITEEDVLFCNTTFLADISRQLEVPLFNEQSGYGCTIEGMEGSPFIPPEFDELEDESSAIVHANAWVWILMTLLLSLQRLDLVE